MKAPSSKRPRGLVQASAKLTVVLAGLVYVGFVTTRFEQDFGWHLAPIGLLMIFGSAYVGEWVERRLGDRVS